MIDMSPQSCIKHIKLDEDELVANCFPSGEYAKFIEWCHAKHQHLVCLWRKLDQDGSNTLHKSEFIRGLKNLAYPGDVDELWTHIDADHSGVISLLNFVPAHAIDIARMKIWARSSFGSLRECFRVLDVDRNGKITIEEYLHGLVGMGMPADLIESARTVFYLVGDPNDQRSRFAVTLHEIEFLDSWSCPDFLTAVPNTESMNAFKVAVLNMYNGNPLVAWRKIFDKDNSMRVSFVQFVNSCKTLARKGISEAAPVSGIVEMYCAFDQARCGWISLREWDKDSHRFLYNFTMWIRKEFDQAKKFVRALEGRAGEGVTYAAFRRAVKEHEDSAEKVKMLFCSLVPNSSGGQPSKGYSRQQAISAISRGKITVADIAFLDRWRLEEEQLLGGTMDRIVARKFGPRHLQRQKRKMTNLFTDTADESEDGPN